MQQYMQLIIYTILFVGFLTTAFLACLCLEYNPFPQLLVFCYILTEHIFPIFFPMLKRIRQNIFTFFATCFFFLMIPFGNTISYDLQFVLLSTLVVVGSVYLGVRRSEVSLFAIIGLVTGITLSLYFNPSALDVVIPGSLGYFLAFLGISISIPVALSVAILWEAFNAPEEKNVKLRVADLYPERLDYYNVCKEYLQENSVIGISSPYGNGKTFLIDVLKEEKTDWTFIDIGALSTTLDNVETVILKEIADFLENHNVFSNSIGKLKSFLNQDVFYHIGEFIFGNDSYVQQFETLVKDVQKVGKVIVLNFEDLDRITDKDHLNKIFAICDTLVRIDQKYKTSLLKVIYQYNSQLLDNQLNDCCAECDKNRYRERFIPFTVEIPALQPSKLFENVRDANIQRYPILKNVSFNFLNKPQNIHVFGLTIQADFVHPRIRGIEQMLDRMEFSLKKLNVNSPKYSVILETICVYHCAEYFMPKIIDNLEKERCIEDLKLFNDGMEKKSFQQLYTEFIANNIRVIPTCLDMNKVNDEEGKKRVEQNRMVLLFLSLLNCNDNYLMFKGSRLLNASSNAVYDDEVVIRVLNRMQQGRIVDDSVVNDKV